MRITAFTYAAIAIAAAGTLVASVVALAGPASAATTTSHLAKARADWKAGSRVVAAQENGEWLAARDQLGTYGKKYVHERDDLLGLTKIPLTDTTAAQRTTAKRLTRELNGFFGTPGLYSVAAGNARSFAGRDWVESSKVSSAEQNAWFGSAVDELDSYGKRYAHPRAQLASLESIPLTNATKKQRETAARDVRALDVFFKTPGVNA